MKKTALKLTPGDEIAFPVLSSKDAQGLRQVPLSIPDVSVTRGEGQVIHVIENRVAKDNLALVLTPNTVGWSPRQHPDHLAQTAPGIQVSPLLQQQHNLAWIKEQAVIEKIRSRG